MRIGPSWGQAKHYAMRQARREWSREIRKSGGSGGPNTGCGGCLLYIILYVLALFILRFINSIFNWVF